MTAPFIWVGTYTIKPGKLETARKRLAEVVDLVEANEPRLIAFNCYLDEAGTTASCVQVHPDATSMVFHMEVIAEHLETAGEWLDNVVASEVYGTPPDGFVEGQKQWEVDPATLRVLPVHEAGFTRTSAR